MKLLSIIMSVVMFFSAGPFFCGRSVGEASSVANNEFACAGYDLTLNILSKSYDLFSHKTYDYIMLIIAGKLGPRPSGLNMVQGSNKSIGVSLCLTIQTGRKFSKTVRIL